MTSTMNRMNQNWATFLSELSSRDQEQQSSSNSGSALLEQPTISAIEGLSVLSVIGEDAGLFLQGQTTCNVLTLDNSSFALGAICTPKGRTLTSFLVTRTESGYQLILPTELLAGIKKRLQLYILRSDVKLSDAEFDYCLFGIANVTDKLLRDGLIDLPQSRYGLIALNGAVRLKLSDRLWLMMDDPEGAINLWTQLVQTYHFFETTSDLWKLHNILAGLPWLSLKTSELFVPQMLNLDVLGGISFNKGCYTGQEIIARTHYLGKQKRRMYLASIQCDVLPQPATPVFVSGNDQSVGQIINAAEFGNGEIRLLLVLQMEYANARNIRLEKPADIPVKILTLPYTF